MQDFQKLRVWHRAHALALKVDVLISTFPKRASASIKSQLGRSADSIATNIVEGCAAATQREFARFLDIAIKSCSETHHHLLSARDRGLVDKTTAEALIDEAVQIRRMLHTLRKRVLLSPKPPTPNPQLPTTN